MSPRRKRSPGTAARALVALYPQPWRERYASEMGALLEDDPPGPRGLLSLLGGALDAHLRPQVGWRDAVPPLVRVRLSLSGLFGCWIALSVLGMAFRKQTEDAGFATATAHHPLLAIAEGAVLAGAIAGALTLALAGLPLVWLAVRQAALTQDRRLAALLASPLIAILAYAAVTLLLVRLAPARHGHFTAGFVLSIMLPWQLAGLACASTLAYAPRAVLARMSAAPAQLRRAARATPVLAASFVVVACGLALYAAALALQARSLADISSGPVGASTDVMLAVEALLAVCVCGPALLCAARARAATL